MYIRLFANTSNSDEALSILSDALHDIKDIIETQEIVKSEPYWKVEEVYVVETEITLREQLQTEKLKHFLYGIADKWISYGEPINEAVASETTKDCNFIMKGVNMINIGGWDTCWFQWEVKKIDNRWWIIKIYRSYHCKPCPERFSLRTKSTKVIIRGLELKKWFQSFSLNIFNLHW